jgi:hypothetical protein
MMRILFPEWRASNSTTQYPFSDRVTLVNAEGRLIPEGTFLDAAFYVIGAQAGLFLSQVDVGFDSVTLTVGDPTTSALATTSFSSFGPPDELNFVDTFGRPAGVLVSEGARLSIFQAWGVGTHTFTQDQTEFAATVCFPTPEIGVRGIQLPSGELLVGDVWLVGDDGVVLRLDDISIPAACGQPAQTIKAIRVDVVGDPLFRRRLCTPPSLFTPPRFIRTIRVIGPNQSFDCVPDELGNLRLVGNNFLAGNTVLRLVPVNSGLFITAVGSAIGQ